MLISAGQEPRDGMAGSSGTRMPSVSTVSWGDTLHTTGLFGE